MKPVWYFFEFTNLFEMITSTHLISFVCILRAMLKKAGRTHKIITKRCGMGTKKGTPSTLLFLILAYQLYSMLQRNVHCFKRRSLLGCTLYHDFFFFFVLHPFKIIICCWTREMKKNRVYACICCLAKAWTNFRVREWCWDIHIRCYI